MPPNNVASFSDIEVQKMKKAVESLMAANEEKVPSEPKYHCLCVRCGSALSVPRSSSATPARQDTPKIPLTLRDLPARVHCSSNVTVMCLCTE